MNQSTQSEQDFAQLGISPKMLATLNHLHFKTPTPIQTQAIPVAITGKDVVGIAQTGTGKSLAFGIPVMEQILKNPASKALILLPTRELALQINETFLKVGRGLGIKTAVLIGGAPMYQQISALRYNPNVIIATPGRLIDHLQQRTVSLNTISMLVLDEADRMFDMGFAVQIKQILQSVPAERQTMLFSATMPDPIIKIATAFMKLPVRVEIARPGTKNENVQHELFFVKKEQRIVLLKKLLEEYKGSVLLFSRTKHGAKKICHNLASLNFSAAEIHSNRSLGQRKAALEGFKTGKYRVLVATDIASRGIDVKGIELVINYELPDSAEDYVHRIGRTGRAGLAGRAISFVTPDQRGKVREVERLIRSNIPVSQLPELPYVPAPAHKPFTPHTAPKRDHNNRQNFYPQRKFQQKRRFSR